MSRQRLARGHGDAVLRVGSLHVAEQQHDVEAAAREVRDRPLLGRRSVGAFLDGAAVAPTPAAHAAGAAASGECDGRHRGPDDVSHGKVPFTSNSASKTQMIRVPPGVAN